MSSSRKPQVSPDYVKRMSREEKLELLDALEERRKRQRLRKPPFSPSPLQRRIIDSPALEKYLFSGNGAGKTTMLVNMVHWACTGYNHVSDKHTPVPATCFLVVDDPVKIEQKLLPEYRKWHDLPANQCHKDGKPHISRITYPNGSVVHIVSHEVNLLKVEGVEATHLFFDEPPPRHIFIGLYRGGRIEGRPLEVVMAGTPLWEDWIRTDIYDKWVDGLMPQTECFFGSSSDNPHLADGYMERFGALLSDDEKATRFHGQFFSAAGQALAGLWKDSVHVVGNEAVWHKHFPCVIAIDPHGSKPHHAVLMGVDREDRYLVLDEFKDKSIAREFIGKIIDRGWFKDFNVLDIVYDSAGSAESTSGEGYKSFGAAINEELQRRGVGRARPTSYNDKLDEDFINRIREVLAIPTVPDNFNKTLPRLRVREACRGSIRDIKQVQWMRDRKLNVNKPKLDIRNTDFLACIKYALAANLSYYKTQSLQPVNYGGGRYSL